MAHYTAADVKKLREMTGLGMLDCKNALQEAEGDFDQAVEILRIKGAKDVGKREGRSTDNGLVASAFADENTGLLLELNCETDFVAKTEPFQELAEQIASFAVKQGISDVPALLEAEMESGKTVQQVLDEANASLGEKIAIKRVALLNQGPVYVYLHKSDPDLPPTAGALVELSSPAEEVARNVAQQIVAMRPRFLTRDEIDADVLENEARIARTSAIEEGKPEQAIEKIVQGKVNAFVKDFTLVDQPWVRDNKVTIGAYVADNNTQIQRFAYFKVGQE